MAAYSDRFDSYQIGQVDDTSLRRIDSIPVATNLQFGVVVRVEIEEFSNKLYAEPWVFDEYPFGITVYDPLQIDGYYHTNKMANILSFGRIWIKPEVDIEAGEIAYVSTATGGITNLAGDENRVIGLFLTSGEADTGVSLQFQPTILR